MIFTVLALIVCIIGFFDFKKGFQIFLIYKSILISNINILSVPGLPMITTELFLSALYFGIYILKGKKYNKAKVQYPFKRFSVFLMTAWFMSSCFSIAGFGAEITRAITLAFSEVITIVLIWRIVESDRDFEYIFKGITIVFLASCLYGVFEYVIKFNPVYQYEITLVKDADKAINNNIYINSFRGYRIQSFFNHAIGAGMNWGLYLFWTFTSIVNFGKAVFNRKLAVITSVTCLLCMLMTNSRAPIIFFIICCFNFVDFKNRKSINFLIFGGALILLFSPLIMQYSTNFTSIFSTEIQEKIGGSTVSMRLDQLGASFEILSRSPIFGMGAKFPDYLNDSVLINRLKGLESVWFMSMTQYGLFGMIAYLYRAYFEIIALPSFFKSRQAFILGLAYWVTYSLTSLPGFLTYLYYIILFYYIKKTDVYKDNLNINRYNRRFGLRLKIYRKW